MVYSLSLLHNSYFFINVECHFTAILTRKIYMLVALVVNNPPADAGDTGDMGLIPGSGKIPCSRKWQHIPLFLWGKSYGERSLAGYSPWDCRVGHNARKHNTTVVFQYFSISFYRNISLNLSRLGLILLNSHVYFYQITCKL